MAALDSALISSEKKEYGFFLDNAFHASKSNERIAIHSPIDNTLVGHIQAMSQAEVDAAIESAFLAQKKWQVKPMHERVDILIHVAALLDEYSEEFTNLIVEEVGKPKKEAHDEVIRTIDLIVYYAEEGRRMHGDAVAAHSYPYTTSNRVAISQRVPLGVVLALTPFNYPLNEVAPKVVSALVMGNSVVLKPATQGSITSLLFATLFKEAGLADGVLNVVTGKSSEIGDALVTSSLIAAINFTGSFETANAISHKAGIKKLILGLSGKDASLVLPDADIDLAVSEITKGAFSYAGQRCTAIKRVLVDESIADIFVTRLLECVVKTYVVGDPRKEDVTMGPLISKDAVMYVSSLVADAIEKGAILRLGGQASGNYMQPTVLDMVTTSMRVAFEEPFGPVLPILRTRSTHEAIALANQSEYGLQSSIFTNDLEKALSLAKYLEVGSIHINEKDARSPDHFPFTGVKHSGLGNVQGARYLLEEVSRLKTIVLPM